MPKISIVAPVYGVEKYIDQFLNSIKKQTLQDIEVILIDDGSPDNCPKILDDFAANDSRYKVFHQKNSGVSIARNTGLSNASGDYVYIVDSDDWLEENALETLWNEAQKTNADIIYGDWISERSNGSTYQHCFPKSFTTTDSNTIKKLQFAVNNNNKVLLSAPEFSYINHLGGAPWRGMFKLSIIKENCLEFDPYVRGLGDDILFTLHLYEFVKKISYIAKPIYHYRKLDTSYSHGYKANYLEAMERIFEKQEEFLTENKKDEFIWGSYYTRVLIYLEQGMCRYFQNTLNKKNPDDRYKEFCKTISSDPYKTAAQKAPIRYMGSKKMKICTFLLRAKLYLAYWELFNYYCKKLNYYSSPITTITDIANGLRDDLNRSKEVQ